MSRPIKMTESTIAEILSDFRTWLRSFRASNGRIQYEKTLSKTSDPATIYFTPTAYAKMKYLVSVFDTEAAWHGTVRRLEEKNAFLITDILVYPQEVTGATVNTDQTKYQDWLMSLDDDVFNSLRFHGHSHVNMGTSPSSVDMTHREQIIQQVPEDDFYIFLIFNKKTEYTAAIYDFSINTLFETSDIDVKIKGSDESGFLSLMSDAASMITKKAAPAGYSYGGNGGYGVGACASGYGYSSNTTKSKGASAVQAAANAVSPKETKKKGKRQDYQGYNWDIDDYDY